MAADLAVIILTYNEAEDLSHALDSVCGWAREVYVLDSHSTDGTLDVAGSYPCEVFQHRFEDYSKQRNWALQELPIRSEWVFFLDADEWLPEELKDEISAVIASHPLENGFRLRWRMIWMGKWIRRGYYSSWLLRLFRHGKAYCEERQVNEHMIVEGATGRLRHDFIHEDRKGVAAWIQKHTGYAQREAEELFKQSGLHGYVRPRFFGTDPERSRWFRYRIYNRLPPLLRGFCYFAYRYFLRGGFLDGKEALIYHFLHGLWYPLLIDINYLELKKQKNTAQREKLGAAVSHSQHN